MIIAICYERFPTKLFDSTNAVQSQSNTITIASQSITIEYYFRYSKIF
jgi:hypothetical protein